MVIMRSSDSDLIMKGELVSSRGPITGFWLGLKDYGEVLELMEQCVAARLEQSLGDHVLYVEHPPVITYGRGTPPSQLPPPSERIPAREVSRGGLATYHGPGQLVGYPIVNLRDRKNQLPPDIHAFLRAIEEALCSYLSKEWQLPALRLSGRTGVWIDARPSPRKIASIGIGVRRWVTFHGFALNVSTNLAVFRKFVPCGLSDVVMTSLAAELGVAKGAEGNDLELREMALRLHPYLVETLERAGWGGGDTKR